MNSKDIGSIGEAKALLEFQKHHVPVSIPWGDNQRYDMIAEFNGKLNKIQVKVCNQEQYGSVICTCRSSQNHTTNKNYYTYEGEVDYFVFYNQKYDAIALVPIEIIGCNGSISLRVRPAQNNQIVNTKSFYDFSFEKYIHIQ